MSEGFPIPEFQHAWVNIRRGAPSDALVFQQDWPVAKVLAPGEVLVKVQAAALNPVGFKLFKLLPNFVAGRPKVPEYDFAGIVVDEVESNFSKGEEVYGWVPSNQFRSTNQGALAQYTKVSQDWIVCKPSNVTAIQAAGFTLAGQTAFKAIMRAIDIKPGQTLFINGGSTAVGAFAIQMAKIKGAKVTASASGKNEEFVRRMGADEFIDYTTVTSMAQHLIGTNAKFDYILEAVGISDPSLYALSDAYMSPEGTYMTVGPQPKDMSVSEIAQTTKNFMCMIRPKFLGGSKARHVNLLVINNPVDTKEFQQYVAQGSIKPIVDSVYKFEETLKAYDRMMSGRATGKVVVKVDSDQVE